MAGKQGTLFDKRFLGRHAGQIMSDPTTALGELVANCWDAYATDVEITWPDKKTSTAFQVVDNGGGMSKPEFLRRWRTIDYNRLEHQGAVVSPPDELENAPDRLAYGQNGRGRHAAFLFSSPYQVRTWKNGKEFTFLVSQGTKNPIEVQTVKEQKGVTGHGTEITALQVVPSQYSAADIRSVLSTRFLLDPSFSVSVDGVRVSFSDIPTDALSDFEVPVRDFGIARVMVIDAQRADRTTKQHGIAWWVKRKLVGRADWGALQERFVDGRTEEAKRYSFIIQADFLEKSVLPDWSGFREDEVWREAQNAIHDAVREVILGLFRERHKETKAKVERTHRKTVTTLPRLSQELWSGMLDGLIENCPTIGERQIEQVMGLLANLEVAQSQYSLLEKLHRLTPADLDAWDDILNEWSIRTAKEALDEISIRLKLIEELRLKTADSKTDEVRELQPLIGRALWIFGPQFESIEFTSNQGMTSVIRKFFDKKASGSLNRPDFVIRPDSSIGFYSRPSFDGEFNESGTDALVVVELKKPGVLLGEDEKAQAWKYIKELKQKGYVTDSTRVSAFVLGDIIDPNEVEPRLEGDRVVIRPQLYSTFIGQAEKRMMNLSKRLSDAPFMREILEREAVIPSEVQGNFQLVESE